MLTILLLGPPQVLLDAEPLAITRRQSRALLYYLAAQRGRVDREQLTDLLWPDIERSAARQTLRTTLHGLRRALGDALDVDDAAIGVAAAVDVDLRMLEQQLSVRHPEVAGLAAALARVRGELLEGFELLDSPGFTQWITGERERVRRLTIRGQTLLARAYAGEERFREALDALERVLVRDPLLEDVQRLAMQIAYFGGDRVGAIRRYEQLRVLLDDELGVPPMAETQAIYDGIVTDALDAAVREQWRSAAPAPAIAAAPAAGPRPAPPGELPFTGRVIEQERLRRALASGRLVLIEGESGIGKTRLAEEELRVSGMPVLRGSGRELDQSIPYQPIVEALHRLAAQPGRPLRAAAQLAPIWRAELARLAPDLFGGGAGAPIPSPLPADELRMREAIGQLLRALAGDQSIALFIDDLHWADSATIGLIGYLARQQPRGVTLLATLQQAAPRSPAAALIHGLTREGRIERIALTRLARGATMALARHLSPRHADALANWLDRHAEGNPYVLSELVHHMAVHGILQANGEIGIALDDETLVIPASVYALIEARLQALSDDARRVLDTAVAIGRSFGYDVVVRAAGLGEEAVLDALDELLAAGLIRRGDGASYLFDHTLTMEVAYREIGEPRHLLLHRRVAEALEQIHRHHPEEMAATIAMHYAEGGDRDRAAPYALLAGRRAAAIGAWTEAISFFEQALAPQRAAARVDVLIELGSAQLSASRYATASETLGEALVAARAQGYAVGAAQAALLLGRSLLSQARFSDAIDVAAALARDGGSAGARAEVLWGTVLSLEGADLEGAAAHFRSAEASGMLEGDPEVLAQIRFELGSVRAQQGQLEQAIAHYREALALAERDGSEQTLAWQILAHNNLGYHLFLLGDAGARAHAEAGLRIARERGVIGLETYLLSTLGEIALGEVDLDTAERWFQQGLDLAEQLATPERIAGLSANLGRVAAAREQQALAIHRFSLALAQADAIGTRHLAAQIRIWLAPLLPPTEARRTIAEARAIAVASGRRRLLDELARVEQALAVAK